MILIGILVVFFIAFLVVVNLLDNKSLNGIKAKKVGNGQHGTARWATKAEFRCRAENGRNVLVYINAQTAEEEQILILVESKSGTLTV